MKNKENKLWQSAVLMSLLPLISDLSLFPSVFINVSFLKLMPVF